MPLKTIGTIELGPELGKGPLGSLYQARSEESDVVVRVVRARLPLTKAALAPIAEAAERAVGLDHPRLATITDVVIEADQVGVVSLAAKGQLLADVLKRASIARRPLSLAVTTRILLDLCEAIAFTHAKAPTAGAAFGGVSPDSALIGPDGVTRLLDTFVAPAARQALGTTPRYVAYQSPEHFQGSDLVAASDVFSLGALAWEMVENRAPFASMSLAEVRRRVLAPLTRIGGDGAGKAPPPAALADAVERALQGDPSKRYTSVLDLASAIEEAAAEVASHDEVAEHLASPAGAKAAQTPAFGRVVGASSAASELSLPRPLLPATPRSLASPLGGAKEKEAPPARDPALDEDEKAELGDPSKAPPSSKPTALPKPMLPVAIGAPRNPFPSKGPAPSSEEEDALDWDIPGEPEAPAAAAPPHVEEVVAPKGAIVSPPNEATADEPPPRESKSPAPLSLEGAEISAIDSVDFIDEVSIDSKERSPDVSTPEPEPPAALEVSAPAEMGGFDILVDTDEPDEQSVNEAPVAALPHADQPAPRLFEAPSAADLSRAPLAAKQDDDVAPQSAVKGRKGLFIGLAVAATAAGALFFAFAGAGPESASKPSATAATEAVAAQPLPELPAAPPSAPDPAPEEAAEAPLDAGAPLAEEGSPADAAPSVAAAPAKRPPSAAPRPASKPSAPGKPPAKKFIPQGI